MRSSVVLPHPEGPSSATSSPSGTSSETSFRTAWLPKDFHTPRISMLMPGVSMAGGHSLRGAFGPRSSRPPDPPARSGAGSSACPCARVRRLAAREVLPPLERLLRGERDEREDEQEGRDRERGAELVLVVEDLDLERDGVRDPADVARHHRDRAELAHRPGVAEDDAVQEAPLHVRERHPREDLPAARAQHERGLLLLGPL